MNKIYMVQLHDYDDVRIEGYFVDYEKAKKCCEYCNKVNPSDYADCGCEWEIETYPLDTIDYDALLKAYEDDKTQKAKAIEEEIRQRELAELARLKAKYENTDEIAINFAFYMAYELAPHDKSEIFFMAFERVDSEGFHFSYELDDDSKHTICVKHTDLR